MSSEDLLNDLINELPIEDRPLYSRNGMRMLVIGAVAISIIWTIINTVFSHYYLRAEYYRDFSETFMIMAIANLVVLPLISLILALPVSLLPIKQRIYKRKLLPVWLWITIVLSSSMFILMLLTH